MLLLLMAASACEDPEVPLGPPRCEPQHEHEVDRRLKLAFKALALGLTSEAQGAFRALLTEEPGHPEAQLGLRQALGRQTIEPEAPIKGRQVSAGAQGVELGGAWLPVGFEVDARRWRFEELRELAPLRKARDGVGAVYSYYTARTAGGTEVAATDTEAIRRVVDLIILHDTHTHTAREALVQIEGQGASTHFIIDWDGAVYQTLDLAFEANHTQRRVIDARSVSIDLVNPVDLGDQPGLPPAAESRGLHRPLSDFVRVQGDEVQQWGYTEAQVTSLETLVRALGKLLPRVPMRVPGGDQTVPRGLLEDADLVLGVAGHLHVSRQAMDPGADFPWESFGRAIRVP